MKKMIIAFIALCTLSVAAFAEVNLKACAGCHGANFEKSAMGKSKIVANMTQKSVTEALVGYKNGTYGGPMKNIMKMQVIKYSDEELQSTGLGKSETKKVAAKTKKTVEKTVKTNVIYEEYSKVAYKEGDNCWVVDYSAKKSQSVECKLIVGRVDMQKRDLLPPSFPGMPSAVFQDLFK